MPKTFAEVLLHPFRRIRNLMCWRGCLNTTKNPKVSMYRVVFRFNGTNLLKRRWLIAEQR
jgi:hypothetical protein